MQGTNHARMLEENLDKYGTLKQKTQPNGACI